MTAHSFLPATTMPCRIADGHQFDDDHVVVEEIPEEVRHAGLRKSGEALEVLSDRGGDAYDWVSDQLHEQYRSYGHSYLDEMIANELLGDKSAASRVFHDCVQDAGISAIESKENRGG